MKPGSTIAVMSTGFLPNAIRFFMSRLGKRLGYKYSYPYNHVEKVIEYNGDLVSIGARSGGVKYTPVEEYLKSHPNHLILEPVIPLTDFEILKMEDYARYYIERGTKYQAGLLLAYALWVVTGIKWFTQGDKKVVCYELVARFDDLIGRRGTKDLDMPTIYEIIENKHFRAVGEVIKTEL